MKQSTTFYRNQFIMCIAAIPLGAVTGAICAVFGLTLLKITDYRTNHYLYLLPFLGVAASSLLGATTGLVATVQKEWLFCLKYTKTSAHPFL